MTATATLPAVTTSHRSLVTKFANKFSIDAGKLLSILKATAFKTPDREPTDEELAALLVVADQYGLNPFTREIFAFPDKKSGIVPVVGVDGWSRLINDHAQCDGFDFAYSPEIVEDGPEHKPCPAWCEVTIHRKDRAHPTKVREHLDEVYRPPFVGKFGPISGPWQSHTKRMLRHKALIQAARVAFGFSGIYDEDEAERLLDANVVRVEDQPTERSATKRLRDAIGSAAPAGQPNTAPAPSPPAPASEDPPASADHEAPGAAFMRRIGEAKSVEALDAIADEIACASSDALSTQDCSALADASDAQYKLLEEERAKAAGPASSGLEPPAGNRTRRK